jgi:hypothetical protein
MARHHLSPVFPFQKIPLVIRAFLLRLIEKLVVNQGVPGMFLALT